MMYAPLEPTRCTVPWLPWVNGEIPSGVVHLLKRIEWHSHMLTGGASLVGGEVLLMAIVRDTGISIESADWYIRMSIELGILGAVEATTGRPVQLEGRPHPIGNA